MSKLIASGSYGTVYTPPYDCKTNSTEIYTNETIIKTNVGKIFNKINDLKKEKFIMKIVNKHFMSFALPLKAFCTTQNNMNQLIYPNGGIDLQMLTKKISKYTIKTKKKWFIKIFKSLELIVNGFKTMNNVNIIHNDIKPANILYSKDSKLCRLIDWGLLNTKDQIYKSTGVLLATYQYFAPEFKIVGNFLRNSYSPTIEQILHRNLKSFGNLVEFYSVFGINMKYECKMVESDENLNITFFSLYKNTLDTYSFGITLATILYDLNLQDENDIKINTIKTFIGKLIHIDPRLRLNSQSIKKEYSKIMTIIQ